MLASVAALVLSALALGTSTWLAVRQALQQKRSRHLPAYLGLLSEFRSREFNDHYLYVCEKLAQHDPSLGISRLPDEARDAVYDIAYYYQIFASLIRTGIVDEDASLAFIHGRVISVWDAISPYVIREREITDCTGHYLLQILEDFAGRARQMPLEPPTTLLVHRRQKAKQQSAQSKSEGEGMTREIR